MKLSEKLERIAPSMTIALFEKANNMIRAGKDVIDFGVGEPDFDTPHNIKEAAIKALKDGYTKYTPAHGIIELRQAICKKIHRENKLDYTPDEVIVSCGAKHSLYNAFQAILNKNDEVIIPTPYWVSYPDMVKLADGFPRLLETKMEDNFQINIDNLKKVFTKNTKAIVLNSPSNPSGALYTEETLKELAAFLVDKEIVIITDDIYEHIIFDNKKFINILNTEPKLKDRTLIINGVSKAYAMTGWRIGYTLGSQKIIKNMSKIQGQSTSGPNSIAQWASIEALNNTDDSVRKMCEVFERRRNLIYKLLKGNQKLKVNKPEGAFYIFPDVSAFFNEEIKTSLTLSEYLLESNHVSVVPGEGFGAPGKIRLSYAMSDEMIKKGIERLLSGLEKLNK